MDIASEKYTSEFQQIKQISELPVKMSVKRSFDVAFLMLPDEKMKQREKGNLSPEVNSGTYPLTELSVRSDLMNHYNHMNKVINSNRSICNGYLNLTSVENRYCSTANRNSTQTCDEVIKNEIPKSAFSKVSEIINVESSVSPPMSPDHLSCSSASPPMSYSPSTTLRPEYANFINSSAFQAFDRPKFVNHGKFRQMLYRSQAEEQNMEKANSEQAHHLQSFQFANSHPTVFMAQPEQFIRNGKMKWKFWDWWKF